MLAVYEKKKSSFFKKKKHSVMGIMGYTQINYLASHLFIENPIKITQQIWLNSIMKSMMIQIRIYFVVDFVLSQILMGMTQDLQ